MKDQWQYLMEHSRSVLSKAEEREAFERLAEARRTIEELEQLERRNRSQAARLRHARRVRKEMRDKIVEANFGLVIMMIKKTRAQNVEPEELLSEGLMILTRSVEHFDHRRGFKFSTYACRCLFNGFTRMGVIQGQHDTKSVVDHEFTLNTIEGATYDVHPADGYLDLRDILEQNLAQLTSDQELVLRKRFGLEDEHPLTLDEVGELLGISRERVRQIQKIALAKLRSLLHTYWCQVPDNT